MLDLGALLYETHWNNLKKAFPDEDYSFVTPYENCDEVVKRVWYETAHAFLKEMEGK
jgi:hypothetical protein